MRKDVFPCPALLEEKPFYCRLPEKGFNKIHMLGVVLVCKLNDNTVNERFKYQCSIDVKNTTFGAYTRCQVNNKDLIMSIRSKHVFNIYATLVLKSFIYSIIV